LDSTRAVAINERNPGQYDFPCICGDTPTMAKLVHSLAGGHHCGT
jgi:hypothetical protein